MKIIAFKVEETGRVKLEQVLTHIKELLLPERSKPIASTHIRLEQAKKEGNLWFVDLTKKRVHGPGKISPQAPVTDFDLAHDEGFGEETALCYDQKLKYLIVQYNHHGPRAQTIRPYFDHFAKAIDNGDGDGMTAKISGFQFIPVMKPSVSAQLRRMKLSRTLNVPCSCRG